MKIRQDFVTNSSSSSFTILGKEVDIKDIDLSKNEYICVGKYLSEGSDIFELNEEMFEYLKNEIITTKLTNRFNETSLQYLDFYKCFYDAYDGYECEISIKELVDKAGIDEKFIIFNFDKDYHSSETVEDLRDRYGDDD